MTQLHLDTITGLHRYGSAPEAGMPALPFRNNAYRKATETPWFEFLGDEDDQEEFDMPTEPAASELLEQRDVNVVGLNGLR